MSVATSGIDYKSTRFHNQLVERHDTATVVSEAIAAQDRKKAFEMAKEQQVKKVIKQAQKENQNRLNEIKA